MIIIKCIALNHNALQGTSAGTPPVYYGRASFSIFLIILEAHLISASMELLYLLGSGIIPEQIKGGSFLR